MNNPVQLIVIWLKHDDENMLFILYDFYCAGEMIVMLGPGAGC